VNLLKPNALGTRVFGNHIDILTTMQPPFDVDSCSNSSELPTGRWHRWAVRLEVNQAVVFAMLLRGWQMVGGFVTVLLVSVYLPSDLQGFYFTFTSLIGVQALFDLGLGTIAVNLVSHEWAKLENDGHDTAAANSRALARLIELGQRLFRWYSVAAILFGMTVAGGGTIFFNSQQAGSVSWHVPWIALVTLTSFSLATTPFIALLEGCNQVVSVNRMRLVQAVLTSVAIWLSLILGGGLWALVASSAVRVLCELTLVAAGRREFFGQFFDVPQRGFIDWRNEVWPLQWRLGIQAAVGFFSSGLLTPIMFHYHGPTVAGQMGLTWTVLMAIQQAALAWIQPRIPRLGMLAARRQFTDMDRLFFRSTIQSLITMATAGTVLWSVVSIGRAWGFAVVDRFLESWSFGLLTLTITVNLVLACQGYYVRACKREPFLVLSLVADGSMGLIAWWLGSQFGPTGAISGLLAVSTFVVVPWQSAIWRRCRAESQGHQ
jgi:hypothetical protein